MPIHKTMQIPKPKDWDELERLVWDLFRMEWRDPMAVRHGRSGQRQKGVDIYGHPNQGTDLAGIQVKGKTEGFGAQLTETEMRTEIEKATQFSPPLQRLIFVTSAPRDATAQHAARALSEGSKARGLFAVDVLGWEDLEERITSYPDLLRMYYPERFGGIVIERPQVVIGFPLGQGVEVTSNIVVHHRVLGINHETELAAKRQELVAKYDEAVSQNKFSPVKWVGIRPDPKFGENLEAFLDQYRQFLESREAYQSFFSRVKHLSLAVKNEGTVAADDVLVEIELPHGIRLLTPDELAKCVVGEPSEPSPPPVWAGSLLSSLVGGMKANGVRFLSPNLRRSGNPPPNVRGPSFDIKNDVMVVVYEVRRLVPGRVEPLKSFKVLVEDEALNQATHFPVTIYGANVSIPQRASLQVEITTGYGDKT